MILLKKKKTTFVESLKASEKVCHAYLPLFGTIKIVALDIA